MLVIDKNLHIGIPTEMFPLLAESCVQRNEMMPMLNNVKLFEDEEFQIRWYEAKDSNTGNKHQSFEESELNFTPQEINK